jgi:NAD(P)-dependent dehydrogenase (short-subunit alcohol dehydrogenase family)
MEQQVIAVAGQHTVLADEALRRITGEGGTALDVTWRDEEERPDGMPTATDASRRLSDALSAAAARHGRLDGLVFVMPEYGAPQHLSPAHLEPWRAIQGGLSTCLHANLAAAEVMQGFQREGAIVNVIPIYGAKAVPGHSFEAAAMAGAISLTKALGVEWARAAVRVNAVLTLPAAASDSPAWRRERIPNRRVPAASEVWEAVRYLLSADARYVTAEALPVDGGWLAYDYF